MTKPNNGMQPAAMAIPREGYFKVENGRYAPVYPQTPFCAVQRLEFR